MTGEAYMHYGTLQEAVDSESYKRYMDQHTKVHTNCLQENNNYCGVIVSDKMIQITIEALQT